MLARIEDTLTAAARFCLAAIAIVVVADVIARYAFDAPLVWADGLVESYLVVAAVYFALSSGEAAGVHVRITVITRLLPPVLRHWVRFAMLLVSALYFAGITAFSGEQAVHAWAIHQTSSGLVPWPVYIAFTIVPVGTLVMTLRVVLEARGPRLDREELPTAGEPIETTIE